MHAIIDWLGVLDTWDEVTVSQLDLLTTKWQPIHFYKGQGISAKLVPVHLIQGMVGTFASQCTVSKSILKIPTLTL